MKQLPRLLLALTLALALAAPALASETLTFSDVPQDHWACASILDMTERGLFAGTTPPVDGVGTFSPDEPMSGAAFLSVLVRYFYPDEIQPTAAGQLWWENALAVAEQHGLLQSGELTNPDGAISRQQMALFLVRALRLRGEQVCYLAATDTIADFASISSAYQTAVRQCYALGLLSGVDKAGRFHPLGQMTRAEAAAVIYRLIEPDERVEANLDGASISTAEWVNTAGGNDNSKLGEIGYIAGQLISDSTMELWEISRPATRPEGGDWKEFNGFLFKAYDYRFVNGGIGLNLEENGAIAKILGQTDARGWGIEVFGWRKRLTSDVATNACLNMVQEAFYYGCGDREVAYALWSVMDYLSIYGSAATTVDVIESFGFQTANETDTTIDLTMNGISIHWDWENGKNDFYF